ncbi:Macrolide export ATP-binding/permease protein MacB [subsurface metagenome]
MSFLNTLKTVIEGLRHSKLRSLLTVLGIIIGVASVIIVLALGTGATQSVMERFRFLGSNQVQIYSVSSPDNPDTKPITFDEALGMEELSLVERVHVALGGAATAARGWAKLDTSITGTVAPTAEELAQQKEENSEWVLAQGEPFTEEDVDYESRVCVIGHTVAEELFLDEDPADQTIRINGIPFLVIGVFEKKPLEKFHDPNNYIKIPISTAAAEFFGRDASVSVTADIASEESIDDAIVEIAAYLRQCHGIDLMAGDEDDFTIRSFEAEAKAAMESARTFTSLLSGLAAVALVVGGIGIMNIMLVSVSERTREIGIRKAIGARHTDIVRQFLLEATVLSLTGGLLGIAAGIGAIPIINHYSTNLFAVFAWHSLPLAFTFSFLVGIVFGFYPARRASRLDPIEALRHE